LKIIRLINIMKNMLFKNFFHGRRRKENIGLISGPLFFIIIIFLPLSQGTITSTTTNIRANSENISSSLSPRIALGTMLWMVIWWITECVPLGFTSLLAPFIFIISGILTVNQALPKFSDPILWIFISGFVLAAAFKKSGLDKRIAYRLATFYKGNNPKIAIFFIACLPVFLLSMTGSITAATTIVFPFVLAFMNIVNVPIESDKSNKYNIDNSDINNNIDSSPGNVIGKEKGQKNSNIKKNEYTEASFLSLGQAATAGAMLLLISTAPNLITKATVEDFAPGKTISFTDWFVLGFPHAIIGLLISWNIIFLFIRPKITSLSSSRDQFKNSLNKMGKITTEEKTVLIILLLALILWIVPSLIRSLYPIDNLTGEQMNIHSIILSSFSKNIPESIPALLIILAIGLIRIRRENKQTERGGEKEEEDESTSVTFQPLLSWNEMLKAIDWNIIFLFGGGLVLGIGIESSGLASWIGNQISHNAGTNLTEFNIFALSAIMGFVMSYAASNTASAVIMCPIAASLAIGAGFSPIPPIIAAGLAASISSAIPSTTPPMAIIYSSRAVSIANMFKTGIVSDLLRLIILITVGPLLISLVF
jgi:sodium-dependent dicarboxylate transporter 2/3/5